MSLSEAELGSMVCPEKKLSATAFDTVVEARSS